MDKLMSAASASNVSDAKPSAKSVTPSTKVLPYNYKKVSIRDKADKIITLQNRFKNVKPRVSASYMSYDIAKEDTNIMDVLLSKYTHIFIEAGDYCGRDKPLHYNGELVFPLDVLTASKLVDGFDDVTETCCEFSDLLIFNIKGALVICINLDAACGTIKYAINELMLKLDGCNPCLVCSGSSVKNYHDNFYGDKYYLAKDDDEYERREKEVRLRTTIGTDLEDKIGAITYSESDFYITDGSWSPIHIAPASLCDATLYDGAWREPLKLKGLKSCAYMLIAAKIQPKFVLLPTTVTDVSNMCLDKFTGKYVDGVIVERTDSYIKVQCKVLTISDIFDNYVERIDSATISGVDYVRYTKYISRFSEGCYVYKVDVSTLGCSDDRKNALVKDVLEEAKQRMRDPSTTFGHTACEEISPGVAYIAINWSDTGD